MVLHSDFAPSYVTDRPKPIDPEKDIINFTQNVSNLTLDLENPKLLESVPELNISETTTETTTDTIATALMTPDSSTLLNKECEVVLLIPSLSAE